ncbi:MAG: LptF/LptG family permease, partial [Hyphomicrobiales bacterium]|nr:LptF/LptG family permease [Hyphomicrobiales bacterium]
MSRILLWYFLRQYGLWFMGFIGVALFAGFLGELAELLRINATGKDFSFALMLRLTSYKMPQLVSDVLPFIFLLATSGFFLRIGESHELLVARLAGLSLWHVLAPLCALAFVVNLFNIGILSSLGSKYFATYWEVRNAAENRPPPHATRVFGLWLYQDRPDGYH